MPPKGPLCKAAKKAPTRRLGLSHKHVCKADAQKAAVPRKQPLVTVALPTKVKRKGNGSAPTTQ